MVRLRANARARGRVLGVGSQASRPYLRTRRLALRRSLLQLARNLHDHHIRFRSRQGGNERDNRISVCAWHHLRGIHAGTIRVTGLVSQGLIWEVGLSPGKPPLFRCAGEEYSEYSAAPWAANLQPSDDEELLETTFPIGVVHTRGAAMV